MTVLTRLGRPSAKSQLIIIIARLLASLGSLERLQVYSIVRSRHRYLIRRTPARLGLSHVSANYGKACRATSTPSVTSLMSISFVHSIQEKT